MTSFRQDFGFGLIADCSQDYLLSASLDCAPVSQVLTRSKSDCREHYQHITPSLNYALDSFFGRPENVHVQRSPPVSLSVPLYTSAHHIMAPLHNGHESWRDPFPRLHTEAVSNLSSGQNSNLPPGEELPLDMLSHDMKTWRSLLDAPGAIFSGPEPGARY